jgi:hypothetical protein
MVGELVDSDKRPQSPKVVAPSRPMLVRSPYLLKLRPFEPNRLPCNDFWTHGERAYWVRVKGQARAERRPPSRAATFSLLCGDRG